MKRRIRKLEFFGIFIIISGLLLGWYFFELRRLGDQLAVYFLDVGQGDATLIRTAMGQNILIDGGPDRKVLRELSSVLPWWNREIDLLVLTHAHDDHLLGLLEVARRYQVGEVIVADALEQNETVASLANILASKSVPIKRLSADYSLQLGEETALKFYPENELTVTKGELANEQSLVVRLDDGQASLLLMADAGNEREVAMIKSKKIAPAEILKLGHHGSDYATGDELLVLVKPELAVISVGKENKFGHPSGRVLKRLERAGVEIRRTDQSGAIKIVSDGLDFRLD